MTLRGAPECSGRSGTGKSAEQVKLEQAEAEIARLRATIAEQAVELHLRQGKSR